MLGIDFSQGLPNTNALVAAGVKFATLYAGYTSPGLPQTKIATPSMVQALNSKGIACVSNWEWDLEEPKRGFSDGQWAATKAASLHEQLGGPVSAPIYFSVDYASMGSDVVPWFMGINSVLPPTRCGVYGSFECCKFLFENGLVFYTWQFADNQLFDKANIHQYQYDQLLGGVLVDYNQSLTPYFGQWFAGGTLYMEKQFDDLWFSGSGTDANGSAWVAFNSGIYAMAKQAFLSRLMGSACKPTSEEVTAVDWAGNPILYQTMSNGFHAEWSSNGVGHLYDPYGKTVV